MAVLVLHPQFLVRLQRMQAAEVVAQVPGLLVQAVLAAAVQARLALPLALLVRQTPEVVAVEQTALLAQAALAS